MVKSEILKGAEVTFSNVSVALGENTILNDISAKIPRGSFTAIIGPNGGGKTSMLQSLFGEIPCSGKITYPGAGSQRPATVGYVPQRLQFDRGMPLTVMEFMVMGWQRIPLWFGIREIYRKKALNLLNSVGMLQVETKRLGALSGGEIQRVLLALALGEEPDLLVLDEPSSGMDFQGEYMLCKLLDDLRAEKGFTLLMVSHDLSIVAAHATHVICLNRRMFAEGRAQDVLTTEILSKTFGIHMGVLNYNKLKNSDPACQALFCGEDRRG